MQPVIVLYVRNTRVTDGNKGSGVKKTKKSLGRYTECSELFPLYPSPKTTHMESTHPQKR